MPTRLQAFLAQQRARGMSEQAIRRALALSRQAAAEAELFDPKPGEARQRDDRREPVAGRWRRP